MKVPTVVERSGKAPLVKINRPRMDDLHPHLVTKIDRKSQLVTDGTGHYRAAAKGLPPMKASIIQLLKGCTAVCNNNMVEITFHIKARDARVLRSSPATTLAIKGAEGKHLQYTSLVKPKLPSKWRECFCTERVKTKPLAA